jgi:NAD(P)-dependent dehydrogenase (short-subunit alcohol dehydrogenase family)
MAAIIDPTLLAGQTALVTGASAGLGYRFATVLAAAGAKVAVAARRIDRLDALVEQIRADGGEATAIQLDMGDADQIPAAVDKAHAALGPVSILVNNAGIADSAPSIEQDLYAIDRMLAVNVRGPFLLAREVAKRLIAAEKPGRVVNIASIAAYNYDGKVPCAFYAATKGAVVRMTEALAVEWARQHINVNAIAPGLFRSEMSGPMIEERGDWLASRQVRGRFGEPHQLDTSLLYLVSPASEFVTGTCLKVEDGQMPR